MNVRHLFSCVTIEERQDQFLQNMINLLNEVTAAEAQPEQSTTVVVLFSYVSLVFL